MSHQRRVTCETMYRLRVNQANNWRDRFGNILRSLASRVDGRYSVAIEMISLPHLSEDENIRIINTGIDLMNDLQRQAVNHEAVDVISKKATPWLYEDSNSN